MARKIISLTGMTKSYGNHLVLDHIDLHIHHGEFLTLVGPSGCGKTTLLRMLAGFETPDQGCITINNVDVTQRPPEERHINMVFQSYALFPHLNVFDNVAFGLKCQKMSKDIIETKVRDVLEKVKLANFADRKPHQLSGGQQQRVAIARAVVNEPLVLLLDEPFSALDYHLRQKMRLELKALQRRLGITFLLVTHDQEEALSMSDRVVVMNHGRIEQVGAPRDIYEEPANLYVAQFIGQANIFNTQIDDVDEEYMYVDIAGNSLKFRNKMKYEKNEKIHILFRPEDIEVWSRNEISSNEELLPASIIEVVYKGSTVDLVVQLDNGQNISASTFFDEDDDQLLYEIGEAVYIRYKPGWEVILPYEHQQTVE